jgi:hypothetical protein
MSNCESSSHFNRNPVGKNQHGNLRELIFVVNFPLSITLACNQAGAGDETLRAALEKYHREKVTNNEKISKRLLADYDIRMRCGSSWISSCLSQADDSDQCSASTVKRRRKEMMLKGSGATMKTIDIGNAEQLIVNKMDKDPAKRAGVRTIMHKIAFEDGIHLTRYGQS